MKDLEGNMRGSQLSELAEYEKTNSKLVSEANAILYDYGLHEVLGKYGKPVVQGSHVLNLMTWRDLDIHLESNSLTVGNFFSLGLEIAEKLKPHRMSFRNELLSETPGLPKGLYWGIYTKMEFPEKWKIDIWAMDSRQTNNYAKRFQDLKSRITETNRPAILRIKSHFCKHPEYRKRFFSMDIYKSVIEDNVRLVEEFVEWLEKEKGLVLAS
jgi:hypothetical protein